MTRDDVFRIIVQVEKGFLEAQDGNSKKIVQIEFVVPFVEGDFSLSVWGFYATGEEMLEAKRDGETEVFGKSFTLALEKAGYDSSWLPQVDYYFDSIENVDKNYEGSMFYRLR